MSDGLMEVAMKPLRDWRTGRLLSVRNLARQAGTSDKTIIQIELGRQVPTFRTMRRISQALGMEPEEITEFTGAIRKRAKGAAPASEKSPGSSLSASQGRDANNTSEEEK